ncbi:MAG: gliding motility-associated C-terminal domain-containing protein [Salibacteraceae bacterium]
MFLLVFSQLVNAAVPSPEIRCVALDASDNITLSWSTPPDPNSEFQAYNIYISNNNVTFNLAANILNYNQSSFTQNGSFAGIIYYYIETVFNDGTGLDTATASDTVSPIIINLNMAVPEQASLSWNPIRATPLPSQGGFYRIYRRVSPTGTWTLIDSVANQPPPPGNIYTYNDPLEFCSDSIFYRIEIPDDLPCTSVSNLAKDVNIKLPPIPPTIDSISVDTATGHVIISWTRDPSDLDIQGYIVVHEVNGLEFKDTIFGINQTTFTDISVDAGIGTQIYGVAAFDTCDVNGFGNVSITNVRHNTAFLQVTPSACDLTNTLIWNVPDQWPVGVVAPISTVVYVKAGNGNLQAIAVLDANDTSFVDSNLVAGETYCYTIQLITANGVTSSSNQSCGSLSSPAAPQTLYLNYISVFPDQYIEVSCLVDNVPGVDNYLLVRSTSPDGPFHRVERLSVTANTIIKFRDLEASPGKHSYFYRVDAIDICNTVVASSNISRNVRLNGQVEGNEFKNTLNWNPYSDWDTVGTGVAGYELYRSFNGVFNPNPVASFSPIDTTFIDDVQEFGGTDGRFCYYIVAQENGGGQFNLQDISRSNTICLRQPSRVFIPNAFHPGGKGENNVFRPVTWYIDPNDFYMAIYTRWGEIIYETTDLNAGWDGGQFNLGTYVYHIIATTSGGEKVEKTGAVTLLR